MIKKPEMIDDSPEGSGKINDGIISPGMTETRMLLKIAPERRMTPLRQLCVALLLMLFFALILAHCTALRFLPDSETYVRVDRPLPVLVLILIVCIYAERSKKTLPYTSFVLGGLVLSLAADIVFGATYDEENVFGMSVALSAKVFYTVGFTFGVGKGAPFKLILCVPFYAFCGAVIALVYQQVKVDMVLFILNLFVTSTMGWRALALTSSFPGSDRAKLLLWLSVVGAALWMCSETLRILNEYFSAMDSAVYLIPMTYYLAQLGCAFSVPRRLTRSDYWLDHFTALIE